MRCQRPTHGVLTFGFLLIGTQVLARVSFANLSADTFTGSYRLIDVKDGAWRSMPADAFFYPRWSPRGSTITWIVRDKNHATGIMLTDSAGKHPRMLTARTRSVLAFGWSDGSTITALEVAPARTAIHARLRWIGASKAGHDPFRCGASEVNGTCERTANLASIPDTLGRDASMRSKPCIRCASDRVALSGSSLQRFPLWDHSGGRIGTPFYPDDGYPQESPDRRPAVTRNPPRCLVKLLRLRS
jgi:hypothetical protein